MIHLCRRLKKWSNKINLNSLIFTIVIKYIILLGSSVLADWRTILKQDSPCNVHYFSISRGWVYGKSLCWFNRLSEDKLIPRATLRLFATSFAFLFLFDFLFSSSLCIAKWKARKICVFCYVKIHSWIASFCNEK